MGYLLTDLNYPPAFPEPPAPPARPAAAPKPVRLVCSHCAREAWVGKAPRRSEPCRVCADSWIETVNVDGESRARVRYRARGWMREVTG